MKTIRELKKMNKRQIISAYEILSNEKESREIYLERKINFLKRQIMKQEENTQNTCNCESLTSEIEKRDLIISEMENERNTILKLVKELEYNFRILKEQI